MAQLSTIISSILRDMIVAQHEANMYAVSLEEIYKKNGRLERFSLPSANIGEVEMELRYGVKDDSASTEQYEINYPMLRQQSTEVSRKLARTALGSVLPVLQSAYATDATEETEGLRKLAGDMATREKYCAFLGRKILKSMQRAFTQLINEDGSLNEQVLTNCTLATCGEEIFRHEELTALFGRPGGEAVREKAAAEMEAAVRDMMPKIVKDVNIKRKRLMPSVAVTVNSQELSGLPDECIHSIKFRISPDNIRLFTDDM